MKKKHAVEKFFASDYWILLLACAALLALLLATAPTAVHAQESVEDDGTVSASQQAAGANSQNVIGGSDAEPGAWPWQVALVRSYEDNAYHGQFCGGTLVAPDWVMTAAHCVDDRGPDSVNAVLGRTDLKIEAGERISVTEIILHSNFNYNPGSYYDFNLNHDVALLRLAESSAQTPITLYNPAGKPNELPFLNATVTGWGYVAFESYYGTRKSALQELTLPLVPHATCNSYEAYDGIVSDNMLCAGYQKGVKGSCYGDSGGPLVVYDAEATTWLQVGIVSWGDGCVKEDKYDVYTRVAKYTPWVMACIADRDSTECSGADSYEPDNGTGDATPLK